MFAWRYKRQSIHHLRIRCFDKQHRSTTAFDTLDGARKHDTQAIGAIAVRFAATIERSHTRVPCQSTRYLHNPMCSLHDEALSLTAALWRALQTIGQEKHMFWLSERTWQVRSYHIPSVHPRPQSCRPHWVRCVTRIRHILTTCHMSARSVA
jgi:hypothetical protein